MLVFVPSNEVGSETLLRYPTSQPKNNQNPTLLQRRLPAGKGSLQGDSISGIFFNICLEDYLFIYSLFNVDVIYLQLKLVSHMSHATYTLIKIIALYIVKYTC